MFNLFNLETMATRVPSQWVRATTSIQLDYILNRTTFIPFQHSLHINTTMPRYITLLWSYIRGHELLMLHLNEGQSVLSMDIIHMK